LLSSNRYLRLAASLVKSLGHLQWWRV
jgi:hypothetical protein